MSNEPFFFESTWLTSGEQEYINFIYTNEYFEWMLQDHMSKWNTI